MNALITIYPFRKKTYANAIFAFGTNRLTAREGFAGVPAEYYVAVQQYVGQTYTVEQLEVALASGWITQQEYDETIAYKAA
jgi:predicted RNA-binding protein associated with RNAse of E/G family